MVPPAAAFAIGRQPPVAPPGNTTARHRSASNHAFSVPGTGSSWEGKQLQNIITAVEKSS